MKILLRSTSFLLPKSNEWNVLEKNNKLIFGIYGDIFSNQKPGKKFDCEVFVIFLNDLIDYFNVKKTNKKKEFSKCKKIIELIEKRIRSNINTNFILSFSTYYYFNYLNEAKFFSHTKEIKLYFTQQLYNLSKKYSNFFILDLDDLFAQHGYDECYDQKNYFTLRCRLSLFGINILSKCISNLVQKIYKTNKKVLLLDCDETLWGGIIGEDGLKNLKLGGDGIGQAYVEFQKAIKKIKDTGIIIGLLSKNNEGDVKQVLDQHKFMILKNKDITAFKVNWREKSFNIKQLSKELFLGLDSFVFWDDNPIERQKVRIQLKEVDVIEPHKDVTNWSKQLLEYKGFSKFYTSKEDEGKTKQYKKRTIFLDNKSSAKNEIHYLKEINIKPRLIKLNNSNLVRSEQMCQKTNQFNFNTKRYKMNDLMNLNKKNFLFLVDLTDDYGKHGIIAQFILKKIENIIFVDLFLMSCRIMGRYLENWILNEIKKIAVKQKAKEIIFEFVPTKKNKTLIKDYIKINKFQKINSKYFKKLLKNKKQKLIFDSSAEYYSFNIKKKIVNLEIYK